MVSPTSVFPSEDTSQLILDSSLSELLIEEKPRRNPEVRGTGDTNSTGPRSLFPEMMDLDKSVNCPIFVLTKSIGFPSHPLITQTLLKEGGSNKQTNIKKKSYNKVARSWHPRCQNHYKPLYSRTMSFVLRGMLAIHRSTAQLFQFLVLHKCPLIMSRGFCL